VKRLQGQAKSLIMAMLARFGKVFFTEFADHTAGVAGKLSFKERDVSCCCIFDAF